MLTNTDDEARTFPKDLEIAQFTIGKTVMASRPSRKTRTQTQEQGVRNQRSTHSSRINRKLN